MPLGLELTRDIFLSVGGVVAIALMWKGERRGDWVWKVWAVLAILHAELLVFYILMGKPPAFTVPCAITTVIVILAAWFTKHPPTRLRKRLKELGAKTKAKLAKMAARVKTAGPGRRALPNPA